MVEGRSGEVQMRANTLWPGLGVEGQADCMSFQITPDHHRFGYVRGCSKPSSGTPPRMWRAYGGRYQAAGYRW